MSYKYMNSYMRFHKGRLLAAFAIVASLSLPSYADVANDMVSLAGSGRFDQLETRLEDLAQQKTLSTAEQHGLCYAYSKTKRYDKLFNCLNELQTKIKQGSKRTILFGLEDATPAALLMRAEAYLELADYNNAKAEANNAIKWLRDDDSDDVDMWANAWSVAVMADALAGNKEAANNSLKELKKLRLDILQSYASAKAFALARAQMAVGDYQGVVDTLQGNKSFGINMFLDRFFSGSFFTGVNNWIWAELPRAYMLNKALLETGQIEAAKQGLERLLAYPQIKQNGEIYWLILHDRGLLAEQQGQKDLALDFYKKAIEVIEQQRASINTETSKIGFVGNKQAIYAKVIRLATELNQAALALNYMERAKSRALVDLLAGREVTNQILAREANNQGGQALQGFLQEDANAKLQLPTDMAKADSNANRGGLNAASNRLKQQAPELAALVTVNSLDSNELRQLLNPQEALLEYFIFNNELYGLAMSGSDILVSRLENTNLEADVRQFRDDIIAVKADSPLATRLYERLVRPFAKIIGNKNVLLVPHGILHYLPFAALSDGQAPFIQQRNIRFLPSTTTQRYLSRKIALRNVALIIGNPDLGKKELDLPSAEKEAGMVAEILKGSDVFTRSQASETLIKRKAGQYRYLHIASHGQFRADNAMASRVLLSQDADNDGSLTVNEIYGLRLAAELVTLSACETGLGKTTSGDDVLGLTRGLLYAGSSNVVASLWEVDDEATSVLMRLFYENMNKGLGKAEALRQAQLILRKTYPEPVFWAAFYLTGSGL